MIWGEFFNVFFIILASLSFYFNSRKVINVFICKSIILLWRPVMHLAATRNCEDYLLQMERELKNLYDLASKARSKGIDPSYEPETHMAKDLAEMVEGLVGPKRSQKEFGN